MSKDSFLLYLRARKQTVDEKIRKAERLYTEGDLPDRVHAAGQLATLRRRREDVDRKIAAVTAASEASYKGLRTEIEEDLDSIGILLDRLVTGV